MDIDWKTLPSLSALRAFDAAARCESFSGAARSLNVTPAAISQQVRALEAELGLSLVRRDGRGIAFTEHGKLLARSLQQGFGAIVEGIGMLRETERKRGIRVTTTPSIVDEFLLSRMAEFWQVHPGVEVSLSPNQSYQDIIKDGFDLAIRGGEGDYPGLNAQHLVDTRWIAMAAPQLIKSKTVDLQDLPWLADRNLDWEVALLQAAGLDTDSLNILNLGDARHSIHAVREGYGVGIANAFIVRNYIASGQLVAIELSGMPPVAYWAVTPPGPRRAPVEDFINWLKIVFADESSKYPMASGDSHKSDKRVYDGLL
jgi:LysR family glycine cleavage system transcriptional activator